MAILSQNLRLVSEREDSIDAIGAAYAPPSLGTTTVVDDSITTSTNNSTTQQFPIGFGSYLDGILPPDMATAAGAFSVSMQQVKNISSIPIEKFAQVVTNIETITGLSVNGTSVPVDTTLVSGSLPLIALGSGPYGTYTMSDFFGCMTGLPYIGIDILGLINALETPALYNIYKQLYLAVTWQPASVTVNTSYNSGTGLYTVTSVVKTGDGGGYGREGLPATITLSNGATGTMTIGTDDTNLSTFGRVQSLPGSLVNTTSGSPITVTVINPQGLGSFSNSVVQGYIDAANTEILAIQTSKQRLSEQMNSNWNDTGTQLTIEQRALDTGLPVPVPPAPADIVTDLAQFPTTQYAFTDSVPEFALNTDPHMQAQSIEAIANLCLPGGQSIVGMMRESRNQARLTQIGILLDNNISDAITVVENKTLLANGSINNTPPAKLSQVDCNTGNEVTSDPYGVYDPNNNNYYVTNPNFGVSLLDTGNAEALGSFAGSAYNNLIPTNLNTIYASKNLLPSTYTIGEAIDEVIRCNCDCWDLI
jgi:hypothetical protein